MNKLDSILKDYIHYENSRCWCLKKWLDYPSEKVVFCDEICKSKFIERLQSLFSELSLNFKFKGDKLLFEDKVVELDEIVQLVDIHNFYYRSLSDRINRIYDTKHCICGKKVFEVKTISDNIDKEEIVDVFDGNCHIREEDNSKYSILSRPLCSEFCARSFLRELSEILERYGFDFKYSYVVMPYYIVFDYKILKNDKKINFFDILEKKYDYLVYKHDSEYE